MKYPGTLVTELVSRRCIIFLGAGVSASALSESGERPKSWDDFLNSALELIPTAEAKSLVKTLIDDKSYLLALEAIKEEIPSADYIEFLNRNFNSQSYNPSDLHRIIFNLDSRIVVTTNFDKIYENYCLAKSNDEGYKTILYNSQSLVDEIRSDTRLIIKAHGSIDDVSSMIFTKSQYHDAKCKHSNFYEVLKALFITNTVIFIGCGLEDPDLLLLLEEVKVIGSPKKPHYAILLSGSHNKYKIRDLEKTCNIKAIEYSGGHANLAPELGLLLEEVETERKRFRIP